MKSLNTKVMFSYVNIVIAISRSPSSCLHQMRFPFDNCSRMWMKIYVKKHVDDFFFNFKWKCVVECKFSWFKPNRTSPKSWHTWQKWWKTNRNDTLPSNPTNTLKKDTRKAGIAKLPLSLSPQTRETSTTLDHQPSTPRTHLDTRIRGPEDREGRTGPRPSGTRRALGPGRVRPFRQGSRRFAGAQDRGPPVHGPGAEAPRTCGARAAASSRLAGPRLTHRRPMGAHPRGLRPTPPRRGWGTCIKGGADPGRLSDAGATFDTLYALVVWRLFHLGFYFSFFLYEYLTVLLLIIVTKLLLSLLLFNILLSKNIIMNENCNETVGGKSSIAFFYWIFFRVKF